MTSEDLDGRVRAWRDAGDTARALTETLRFLGPELFGFLLVALESEADADEVFSRFSESLWKSLATFEWRCSLRTWAYVLARHEIGRHRRGSRRHVKGHVPISELEGILAAVRTETRSTLNTEAHRQVVRLRAALPIDDRTLLVLRVDRRLQWEEIALAFADDPERLSDADRKRESARLRKRYQAIKQRLALELRRGP